MSTYRDTIVIPVQPRASEPARPPLPPNGRIYNTETDSCLSSCLTGIAASVGILLVIAICISTVCFFVSGLVFTIQEYGHIPDCAEAYRAWSITMVSLFGISALSAKNSASIGFSSNLGGDGKMAGIALGISLWIIAIFPGLIAGLGSRDVLHHPADSCDLSEIHQLVSWTRWIVYYSWTLVGLLGSGGICSCLFS